MARSLQTLLPVKNVIGRIRLLILRRLWGMTIADSAKLSLGTKLDITYPRGVRIGEFSYLTFGVVVLTHDRTRGIFTDTTVGRNCFIGVRSILMPGVTVGDGSIVGSGSVVTKDVPPGSIVAGNPARILASGIEVGKYGRFADADDVTYRLMAEGKYIP